MIAEEEPRSRDAGPDPLADDGETMRDIRTCEALHEARASFQDTLVEGSAVQDRHFAAQLRQEPSNPGAVIGGGSIPGWGSSSHSSAGRSPCQRTAYEKVPKAVGAPWTSNGSLRAAV